VRDAARAERYHDHRVDPGLVSGRAVHADRHRERLADLDVPALYLSRD
jgi:hypothetical protein